MSRMFTVSTSDTPETAASPAADTMIVSAMPTAIASVCSIIRGMISFFRSPLEYSIFSLCTFVSRIFPSAFFLVFFPILFRFSADVNTFLVPGRRPRYRSARSAHLPRRPYENACEGSTGTSPRDGPDAVTVLPEAKRRQGRGRADRDPEIQSGVPAGYRREPV